MDLDQPEGVIAADVGLSLIPVEIEMSIQDDRDAAEDEIDLLLTADRTQATAAGGTVTEAEGNLVNGVSIQNCLDGAPAFGGRAFGSFTADIADPVHSDILATNSWETVLVAAEAGGSFGDSIHYHKEWDTPELYRGPSQFLFYLAGTVAPEFMGFIKFAAVPSEWFPTS